jgi:hypothetical protein
MQCVVLTLVCSALLPTPQLSEQVLALGADISRLRGLLGQHGVVVELRREVQHLLEELRPASGTPLPPLPLLRTLHALPGHLAAACTAVSSSKDTHTPAAGGLAVHPRHPRAPPPAASQPSWASTLARWRRR